MNFYYDPILGLKYDYLGELFLIDIESIPNEIKFDMKKWIYLIKEQGIMLQDSVNNSTLEVICKITDYIL